MQTSAGRPTTAAISTTQEVLLRTLASDVAALQHGNQAPTPQQYTTRISTPGDEETADVSHADSGRTIRLVLALLFLAGVGIAMYYFVYPSLVEVRP